MANEDRIKLAEAMGYRSHPEADTPCWWSPDGLTLHTLHEYPHLNQLPDPFNDANDDYAVLEWMRDWRILGIPECDLLAFNENLRKHWDLTSAGDGTRDLQYVRGDYARAALKVLNDGK